MFTHKQLSESIDIKNVERFILKKKIKKNKLIEVDQVLNNNFMTAKNKKALKIQQLRRKNSIILRHF